MHFSRNKGLLPAGLIVLALALAGCGPSYEHTPEQTSSTTSSSVTTSPSPTSVPTEADEAMSAIPEPPAYDASAQPEKATNPSGMEGADAAPQAQFYNSSNEAKQAYYDWWVYEVQVPQDYRDFSTIYTDGIAACGARARGAGVTAIETTWKNELGYTASGASAILKAALVALCPQYDLGYTTYFDRNVQAFASNAMKHITFGRTDIKLYEFGAFMEETCASLQLSTIGGTGIVAQMGGLVNSGYFTLVDGSVDMNVLYILINEATKAGCMGSTTWLPPVVQMSS
jgi:hypothetical protein